MLAAPEDVVEQLRHWGQAETQRRIYGLGAAGAMKWPGSIDDNEGDDDPTEEEA